jgi:hypothetical protein
MAQPGVPNPDPYVDPAQPIALSPETYERHAAAVDRIEGANNARYPRAGRGRTTSASAGCWAKLASGGTISAASGLALGSGTVELCDRIGSALTGTGEMVQVLNAGDAITASTGDKAIKLTWSDGDWAASRCN